MINYLIESENSTDHWSYFDSTNHNVLDLGCGRWYTDIKEELSPFYFGKNANLVVGIDSNPNDIEYYNNETINDDKYVFELINLTNVDQFRELIKKYSITAIKCDIEGHEVSMLDLTSEDLINVTELGIEYHTEELKNSFIPKVQEWGFEINVTANFARTPNHMGVIFCRKKNIE
jgi:SAM-dependent methyltransferase